MVTNTPVGVLRAVVIFPSCLDFTVVHRRLRQTSTCRDHGRIEVVTKEQANLKLFRARSLVQGSCSLGLESEHCDPVVLLP